MAPGGEFGAPETDSRINFANGYWGRKVYVAAGSRIILSGDGADRLTDILRENFAPGAADSVYREVVWFSRFKRAAQTMDFSSVESDALRRQAESKMWMGGGSPEAFAPAS